MKFLEYEKRILRAMDWDVGSDSAASTNYVIHKSSAGGEPCYHVKPQGEPTHSIALTDNLGEAIFACGKDKGERYA